MNSEITKLRELLKYVQEAQAGLEDKIRHVRERDIYSRRRERERCVLAIAAAFERDEDIAAIDVIRALPDELTEEELNALSP